MIYTYHRKDKEPYMFLTVVEHQFHQHNILRHHYQEGMSSILQDQIPGYSWNCASVP